MKTEYYHSKESVEEYIKASQGFDGRELVQRLKDFLPSGSSLLELGSGPGTDFLLLKDDFQVVGSDFSAEFLNRLKSENEQDEFLLLDAITLKTDRQFDGIYSNKVLQHLSDAELEKSIQRQSDLLHAHGIICHSFWKGEGEEYFKGMRVNYQDAKSLKALLEGRFKILLLEAYQEFEEKDSLLLIAAKK